MVPTGHHHNTAGEVRLRLWTDWIASGNCCHSESVLSCSPTS